MPLKFKPNDLKVEEKCDTGSFAGLPLWRPGLDRRPGHAGFMVDKVTPTTGFSV
jgi:hypothetical protein